MSENPVRLERRAAQRFYIHVPLTVRRVGGEREEGGFAQDLSARGVFFYTDFPLETGAELEITLVMPSEITLSENMRVRCRGLVLRVSTPMSAASPTSSCNGPGTKAGVAVHLQHYEYLSDLPGSVVSTACGRIGALRDHPVEEDPSALSLSRNALRNLAIS